MKTNRKQRLMPSYNKRLVQTKLIVLVMCLFLFTIACKKNEVEPVQITSSLNSIKEKLKAAGFDVSRGFSGHKNGYLVEGDIFMTAADIDKLTAKSKVEINPSGGLKNSKSGANGKIGHYNTGNLLTLSSTRRTIHIYMDTSFGTYLQNSLDAAIARYNDLDMSLEFARTTNSSTADINIRATNISPLTNPNEAYLMAAGFPDQGDPYNEININTFFFNSATDRLDATSSLVHEIGHCIGLRHTDYMDRSFSCGGYYTPEDSSFLQAIHIPGTPTAPELNSVMLACSNDADRPFTSGDIIALKESYDYKRNIHVKFIHTLVSNDSYISGGTDYEKITWTSKVEFYQNAALTIPYTTSNYMMFNVETDNEFTPYFGKFLIPNGVTSYDFGAYVRDKEYSWGNLVRDDTNGLRANYGNGYYLYWY